MMMHTNFFSLRAVGFDLDAANPAGQSLPIQGAAFAPGPTSGILGQPLSSPPCQHAQYEPRGPQHGPCLTLILKIPLARDALKDVWARVDSRILKNSLQGNRMMYLGSIDHFRLPAGPRASRQIEYPINPRNASLNVNLWYLTHAAQYPYPFCPYAVAP